MKKCMFIALATIIAASMAFADLGSVVRSFAIPGGNSGGSGRSNGYLYSTDYSPGTIYRMNPTSGSVVTSYTAAGGSNTRGLAYQWGGYLWQNQAYSSPYRIYRTNEVNGSVYNYYSLPTNYVHGSAVLATGDGGEGTTRIILSRYNATSTIYYMTTTGTISSSISCNTYLYEVAYDWRNRLIWGGMNDGYVYGFTTTGSRVASFRKPSGNVYSITYHGQYLWVAGTSGMFYQIHCPGNVGVKPTSMGKIKAMFE
jgi:hypothetical protein